MIVLNSTEDKVVRALQAVAGIVERRHTLPILANNLIAGSTAGTLNSVPPETDGGDTSAAGIDVAPSGDGGSGDDDGGDAGPEPRRSSAPELSPEISGAHRDATVTAGDLAPDPNHPRLELWRLPTVLQHLPVSRSSWFAGVKAGRYPAPVRLSPRRVAWRSTDIQSLIASL